MEMELLVIFHWREIKMYKKILKILAEISWLYPIIILLMIFICGIYVGRVNRKDVVEEAKIVYKDDDSKKIENKATENVNLSQSSENEDIKENGNYSDKEELSAYIHLYNKLPINYISKKDAIEAGWKQGEENLDSILPGMSIGGDEYGNSSDCLPKKEGRKYYEADVDYTGGVRNSKRIIYSNDGLIFYTEDGYENFERLY